MQEQILFSSKGFLGNLIFPLICVHPNRPYRVGLRQSGVGTIHCEPQIVIGDELCIFTAAVAEIQQPFRIVIARYQFVVERDMLFVIEFFKVRQVKHIQCTDHARKPGVNLGFDF